MMRKTLTLLTALALTLGLASSGFAQYDGVVSIGSAQVPAGESFSVPVEISGNDIDISILSLPVQFSSDALTLDSVSAVGAVWTSQFNFVATINNTERTARISVQPNVTSIPLPTVAVTDGLLARLHFTVDPAATPQFVTIDSILTEVDIGSTTIKTTAVQLADNTGGATYYPDVVSGEIEILVPTDVDDDPTSGGLPTSYSLAQNYPNPFNPVTTISFALPTSSHVRLTVYNILGQQVRTLLDQRLEAGGHRAEFDGASLPSGIYFYRLTYDEGSLTRKMILVK